MSFLQCHEAFVKPFSASTDLRPGHVRMTAHAAPISALHPGLPFILSLGSVSRLHSSFFLFFLDGVSVSRFESVAAAVASHPLCKSHLVSFGICFVGIDPGSLSCFLLLVIAPITYHLYFCHPRPDTLHNEVALVLP